MKSLFTTILFVIISIFAIAQTCTITTNWTFRQVGTEKWLPSEVPGLVHTDLIHNGIIKDPFFRLNERDVQWVDKEDWEYKNTFDLNEEMFSKQNIEITFYGLDTYADVYLNDSLILQADNMFRTWKIDIKGIAKQKGNELRIYFHSPITTDIPKFDALDFHYASDNDQSQIGGIGDKQVGIFARKAGYHYGWDWGPRLVTSGIWRPVEINAWDNARISNVKYDQIKVGDDMAAINAVIEVDASSSCKANITISASNENVNSATANITRQLVPGTNIIEIPIIIKKPKLWWCNGLGEPNLYEFTASLRIENNNPDLVERATTLQGCTPQEIKTNVGLRNLKLVRDKDQYGTSFYFQLNGVNVFMKGANYIPQHSFLTEVTDSMYERTILDAVSANMNMLRVWGGGIYENDIFYDLCDKYGILVWQDFMFACSLYPTEGEMLENVRQEAIDNVKRLRNHPCIALWCGNNECQAAWYGWGYKRKYDQMGNGISEKIWKQFYDCYFVTLPEVVEKYDTRDYVPSSPYNGDPYGRPETGDSLWNPDGDGHYWGVWQTEGKLSTFNDIRCRFFSEYGFQSFADYQSVMQFAPDKNDHDIYSEVMMSHQRGGQNANSRIMWYMESEYGKPKNFEETLYLSQLMQGDAIKIAIEAHRRDKPYCMGTLFWQHNDCWPVASWSSRDFYGRWKAQHYFARKAYRNILVSPIVKDSTLYVFAVSDSLATFDGCLTVSIMDFRGNVIFNEESHVSIKANASEIHFSRPVFEILNGKSPNDIFIYTTLQSNDSKQIADNIYFLCTNKEMRFPKANIKWKSEKVDGGILVTLCSKTFARGVFLSINGIDNFFSDNYFDLLPNVEKKVLVRTSISKQEFNKQLKLKKR